MICIIMCDQEYMIQFFLHIKYEAVSKFTGYNDTKSIGVLNERTSRQQNFSNKTHRRLKLKMSLHKLNFTRAGLTWNS